MEQSQGEITSAVPIINNEEMEVAEAPAPDQEKAPVPEVLPLGQEILLGENEVTSAAPIGNNEEMEVAEAPAPGREPAPVPEVLPLGQEMLLGEKEACEGKKMQILEGGDAQGETLASLDKKKKAAARKRPVISKKKKAIAKRRLYDLRPQDRISYY